MSTEIYQLCIFRHYFSLISGHLSLKFHIHRHQLHYSMRLIDLFAICCRMRFVATRLSIWYNLINAVVETVLLYCCLPFADTTRSRKIDIPQPPSVESVCEDRRRHSIRKLTVVLVANFEVDENGRVSWRHFRLRHRALCCCRRRRTAVVGGGRRGAAAAGLIALSFQLEWHRQLV
jgi:hypothetical protein